MFVFEEFIELFMDFSNLICLKYAYSVRPLYVGYVRQPWQLSMRAADRNEKFRCYFVCSRRDSLISMDNGFITEESNNTAYLTDG